MGRRARSQRRLAPGAENLQSISVGSAPIARRGALRGAARLSVVLAAATSLIFAMTVGVGWAVSVPDSSNISASGTQLYLNGSPYNFVGVDAYEAATEWGVNGGVART